MSFHDSVWNSDCATILASGCDSDIKFNGDVHNSGLIKAAHDATIEFNCGTVDNCGTIKSDSGAHITFDHWVSGDGTLAIGGGTVELVSGTCNYIQFCGPDGTLTLNNAYAAIGQISGFGPGDAIDFANLPVGDLSIVGFTGGVLDLHSNSLDGDLYYSFSGDGTAYTAYNFALAYDGDSGTKLTETPYINVFDQQIIPEDNDATLVQDFKIVEPFAADDLLTITATAGHGTLDFANPADVTNTGGGNTLSATATLAEINYALADGIIYTASNPLTPEIDNILMTVDDGHGGSEQLNLIFKAAETQGGETFDATAYNDVIYGTGHADTFEFLSSAYGGHDVITGFESGTDKLFFDSSIFSSAQDVLGHAQSDGQGDTIITEPGNGNTITLLGANLQAGDIEISPPPTVAPTGSVASSASNNSHLLVGTGIPASGFGLVDRPEVGLELGLQVIYRQGPVVTTADTYNDGVLHFQVNPGTQSTANGSQVNNANRAAWSFEYSVATGLNGQTTSLSNFDFKLLVDVDPSANTDYHTLEMVSTGTGSTGYVWVDDSVPANGAGTLNGHPIVITDDGGTSDVAQNSENYAFNFIQSYLTSAYGPSNSFAGPAHFDIVLEALSTDQSVVVATNHIAVDVAGNGTWISSAGGDWSTASNWYGNYVPVGSTDDVFIAHPVGQTVTFDGNSNAITSVKNLTIGDVVTFDVTHNGSLFLNNDLNNGGVIDINDAHLAVDQDGVNTGAVTVEGTGGVISSTLDISRSFANSGTVIAGAHGEASFGAVAGSGLLAIDGGALALGTSSTTSTQIVDTNDIQFGLGDDALLLSGHGQIAGNISGFGPGDTIAFIDEQVTVAGYQDHGSSGVLHLHLHSTDGTDDSDLYLQLTGTYELADFVTQFDGLNTLLYDEPPGIVGSSFVSFTNVAGGDWGIASNWSSNAVPSSGDGVLINSPVNHTVTFDGSTDGLPNVGIAQIGEISIGANVTFDIFNQGSLFLSGDFENAGAVIADRGEIAGMGGGTNTGTITLSGDDSATGALFLNGTFNNTGHVVLNAGGSAQFGAVTGTGDFSIVGGVLEFDPLGHASSGDTADTNNISFNASNSTLLLGGEGQVTGTISGFGVSDSIGFLNEQVTITSYVDNGTDGVLTLHVHSLDGAGDTDLSLNLQGSYDRADFLVVHGGQNSFLVEKPPGIVQSGTNGVWIDTAGGDWGTASNWHNNVVPGSTDDILISTPAGHTVTFNGAIDGAPGYGFAQANSLTVGANVTFQVSNRGELFFAETLANSGTVDVVNSGLSFAGDGTNGINGLITVEGTTGVISSTFDMDNGTLANSGTVDAKARGWTTIRSVTGGGTLKVDGGVIQLGGTDVTSAQTIDTNAIVFAAAGGLLMLDGQGAVAGDISGFNDTDNVSFIDEQVSVVNYDINTGVLQLHLHSLDGLGDHNVSLTFDGHLDGSFSTQFDGLDSLLYFNPTLGTVGGGLGAGAWSNVQGGDWGVAGNWTNNAVPDSSDDISLTAPAGHTVTFNGAIDGQAGLASAGSLTVGAGVTFDVTHHGSLFFSGDLHNDGFIDVLNSGLSFGGHGSNTGTIDVHGTSGFISSTLDIDNGALNNTGTVIAGPHGEASFGSVTGTGVMVIDGGDFSVSGADSNDLQFSTAHSGELLTTDPTHFTGTISGFAPVTTLGALPTAPAIAIENENVTVSSYVDHGNHTGTLHLSDGSSLNFEGDYAQANFVAQFDGLATTITDQGPVMSTANVQVAGDASSSMVTGISISDFFDLNPNDLFTITATAGHGTLALAVPGDDPGIAGANTATLSGTGTLSQINHALSDGVIYTPSGSPSTDNVSVTIQDHNGAIDEVNFIFNQSGTGPVSLTGTAGKDVLYGTGYNDTLTGGASSDSFVFRQFGNVGSANADHVTDFNVFQDYLDIGASKFANVAALLAATHDVGGNAQITVDANNTITLDHVTTAQLSAHQDHLLVA